MFTRSSWLHLRLPFSWFLLPVFLFALASSPNFNGARIGWVFFIVHLLLYPASNGYNSYFDKDEKSIGGLKNPPPVRRGLYWLALSFDALAVVAGLIFLNLTFSFMLLVYGLVSKAYSHPAIRLKKYAVTGWVIAGLFQGLFTFLMCYCGLNNFSLEQCLQPKILMAGGLTTLMLWANYPMTQVFQHEEDQKRGDRTLSIVLGTKGTFLFAACFFAVSSIGFYFYLQSFFTIHHANLFVAALLPALIFFFFWFTRVNRDQSAANYRGTMALNMIAATGLNVYFSFLFIETSHILQVL